MRSARDSGTKTVSPTPAGSRAAYIVWGLIPHYWGRLLPYAASENQ